MTFNELIAGLGAKLGLELTVENDVCTLGIDDMVVAVQVQNEVGQVIMSAEIGEPPPQGLEQLLSAMLNANYFFLETGGATISRNPETGNFFLCRYDGLETLDVESLMAKLEKFVNVLETWRDLVANYRPVQNEVPGGTSPFFGGEGFLAV